MKQLEQYDRVYQKRAVYLVFKLNLNLKENKSVFTQDATTFLEKNIRFSHVQISDLLRGAALCRMARGGQGWTLFKLILSN